MAAESLSLAGKVAIVTGSGRENGIGASIARALARNGASVTVNYVSDQSASRAENVAQEIRDLGARTTIVQAGVETQAGAAKIVTDTLKAFDTDHVDILVNNAGLGSFGHLLTMAPEHLQREFSVNVFGTLFMTQAVVTQGKMPRGGRIINIGSIMSQMGPEKLGVYAATKAATNSLTATWAWELGRTHGITINTVAPGPVITDINAEAFGEKPMDKETLNARYCAQARAEERIGTTEDIADVVLLLTSEKSRWITGQMVSVDGGLTVK
ncbi:uncharacterized protein BCR38DRAFT_362409 [Pseudomassariella vexata]|uniref:Uncharacterized protein n=1 Tax=Pseudomassariella vexata TaxID=1141098 RepID=A0A1Y2E9C5_9PEZI|nr:uncharacterized protein BCR38DRAFT_362409 [Pseudomassariella vexata]ORY68173.1 hypothetical protein BCR38DRAFT_362409 [Pseudomassariella vexata]